MATTEPTDAGIPPEVLADLEQVCRQAAAGGSPDPELLRRVSERAAAVRREILAKHGILNVAVDLIRESRDEA